MTVEKKDLDWGSLDFGYHKTDYSFEAHWKDGEWDEGGLTTDHDLPPFRVCGLSLLPGGLRGSEGLHHRRWLDRLLPAPT